jgi:radical SAM protein with 4Fe4S-binding SPASM domain
MSRLQWLTYDVDEMSTRRRLEGMVGVQVAENRSHQGQLRTIYLFLTRKCNLSCQHCYIEGVGPARDQDFDLDTIKGLIDRAIPHGLKKVKVSGGEPFVRRDVMDVLKCLDERGLEIVLETNGTLFAPDTVEQLAALRKFTVFISLDHADEAAHDKFRGLDGSYRKTVRVLREMGQTAIQSVVTTTAMRYNYDSVVPIADMVLDWGIKRHRTLLNIHPLGNARGHLDNAITMEEAEVLIGGLLQSSAFASGRAYMTLPPALMPLAMLRDLHTCGWGTSVVGILSNGDVSMCSASYEDPDMIGGNAFNEDFVDLWANGTFFKNLREIGEGRVKGVCGNCVFYEACRGVCRMSSYSHYGEVDAPYPLCQEVYNAGAFPRYALVDPERDCTYDKTVIKASRSKLDDGVFIPLTSLRGGTALLRQEHA